MSSTPATPGVAGPSGTPSRGVSQHSALLAAGILVAVVGAVLIAHAVHAGAAGTPSTSAGSAMKGSGMSDGSMSGMSSGMSGSAPSSNRIATIRGTSLPTMPTSGAMPTAMPMVPLGQADWEGIKIATMTSAPATFILMNGSKQQFVRPTPKDSFHLMVTMSDASTGFAIPYSSVWATIRKDGKIVFDERLWPMVSRYMGPHFGNNVALPGAGLYHLSLLVSPPAAARHLEYKNLWLEPHRVNLAFRWVPKT
jgi:Fe2+ transport protein